MTIIGKLRPANQKRLLGGGSRNKAFGLEAAQCVDQLVKFI